MPLPTPEQYRAMIDAAAAGGFAFPAVNVTSTQTLNAAIRGFAEAGADGIVQVTTGGAAYLAGPSGDAVPGARVRGGSPTSCRPARRSSSPCTRTMRRPSRPTGSSARCWPSRAARVGAGGAPLFHSHMFDGSTLPLEDNLRASRALARGRAEADACSSSRSAWSAAPRTTSMARRRSGAALHDHGRPAADGGGARPGERGRYLLAATFGNVHGAHPPGHVAAAARRSCATGRRRSRASVRARASTTCSMARAGRRRRSCGRPSATAS